VPRQQRCLRGRMRAQDGSEGSGANYGPTGNLLLAREVVVFW
jgi:hypothetical protein